ncbi:MAG: hypothetical protein JW838_11940 [Spirochaetes bacterium]|nr:hypothetical protein [Spirochaetota bacterium]
MNIPFTTEQFIQVIVDYNTSVWPAQIVLNLLAMSALFFIFTKRPCSERVISAILAFLWIWMGAMYHLVFFTSINKLAYGFGTFFILQGILFVFSGSIRSTLSFSFQRNAFTYIGLAFIIFALILYPIIGYYMGHPYPKQPTFGLPCPTTIFTFGLLLLTDKIVPKYILIIPFVWSIIGFFAAIKFTITEDYGLLAAGIIGIIGIVMKDRKVS